MIDWLIERNFSISDHLHMRTGNNFARHCLNFWTTEARNVLFVPLVHICVKFLHQSHFVIKVILSRSRLRSNKKNLILCLTCTFICLCNTQTFLEVKVIRRSRFFNINVIFPKSSVSDHKCFLWSICYADGTNSTEMYCCFCFKIILETYL